MSVLSWIKLSVCLWLLRKAAKLTGWGCCSPRPPSRPGR